MKDGLGNSIMVLLLVTGCVSNNAPLLLRTADADISAPCDCENGCCSEAPFCLEVGETVQACAAACQNDTDCSSGCCALIHPGGAGLVCSPPESCVP